MLFIVTSILIIIVVGALLFYLINRFIPDERAAYLLKILVLVICLAAILHRAGVLSP